VQDVAQSQASNETTFYLFPRSASISDILILWLPSLRAAMSGGGRRATDNDAPMRDGRADALEEAAAALSAGAVLASAVQAAGAGLGALEAQRDAAAHALRPHAATMALAGVAAPSTSSAGRRSRGGAAAAVHAHASSLAAAPLSAAAGAHELKEVMVEMNAALDLLTQSMRSQARALAEVPGADSSGSVSASAAVARRQAAAQIAAQETEMEAALAELEEEVALLQGELHDVAQKGAGGKADRAALIASLRAALDAVAEEQRGGAALTGTGGEAGGGGSPRVG
jgi:hypothetical protein